MIDCETGCVFDAGAETFDSEMTDSPVANPSSYGEFSTVDVDAISVSAQRTKGAECTVTGAIAHEAIEDRPDFLGQ
jgi:hypothetical protein